VWPAALDTGERLPHPSGEGRAQCLAAPWLSTFDNGVGQQLAPVRRREVRRADERSIAKIAAAT
jgi:hypothetical protein